MRRCLLAALFAALSATACLAQTPPPSPPSGGTLSPAEMLQKTHEQVDAMAARLAKGEGAPQDWLLLARSYLQFEEFDKAKDAANHLIALAPKDVEPRMVLGEAQMAAAPHGKKLPEDFLATMRGILAIDPTNPNGLYYVGLGKARPVMRPRRGHCGASCWHHFRPTIRRATIWSRNLRRCQNEGRRERVGGALHIPIFLR